MTVRMQLSDISSVARPIIEDVIWATVATVGPNGQPRTRLMHPVWLWDTEVPTALVSARPTPLKVEHLAFQPVVSCHYWDQSHDTVAIDATATWVPAEERGTAWDSINAVPEPVGFDPTIIWPGGSDSDDCAFIHLKAHRIIARPAGSPGVQWDH